MYLGPWSIYQKVREKDNPVCDMNHHSSSEGDVEGIEGLRSTPTARWIVNECFLWCMNRIMFFSEERLKERSWPGVGYNVLSVGLSSTAVSYNNFALKINIAFVLKKQKQAAEDLNPTPT